MKLFLTMLMCVCGFVGFADEAVEFLKLREGTVMRNGMHIVYDDADSRVRWNGEETFAEFKARCKGKPTIGYGFTSKRLVTKCAITDKEAHDNLVAIVNRIRVHLRKDVKVELTEHQETALISFIFNVGYANFLNSTLLKKLNAGDFIGAANEFSRWKYTTVKGKKVLSRGLVNRRRFEREMFLK